MGRDTRKIEIVASVSRHNSEQDVQDDEAVDNLRMEIEALVASNPEYERVVTWVSEW